MFNPPHSAKSNKENDDDDDGEKITRFMQECVCLS